MAEKTKYCKFCGEVIPEDAVLCTKCGRQVEKVEGTTTNSANEPKNKWISFLLCFFLGTFGAHKFYEGKIGMGILYLFTLGLLGFGALVDLIIILCKPNPYYTK